MEIKEQDRPFFALGLQSWECKQDWLSKTESITMVCVLSTASNWIWLTSTVSLKELRKLAPDLLVSMRPTSNDGPFLIWSHSWISLFLIVMHNAYNSCFFFIFQQWKNLKGGDVLVPRLFLLFLPLKTLGRLLRNSIHGPALRCLR